MYKYFDFEDTRTGNVHEEFMTLEEKKAYLKKNKHVREVCSGLHIGDPVRLGVTKVSNSMKEVLNKAKKAHPHGHVNTRGISEI